MDVALQLILPIIVGFLAGQWIDQQTGKTPSWTLTLGGLGIIMGFSSMAKRAYMEKHRIEERLKEKREREASGQPAETDEPNPKDLDVL